MLESYPKVVGEWKTLMKLMEGHSLARFNDGEQKMLEVKGYAREPANEAMAEELREIIANSGPCLVGIQVMDRRSPKWGYLKRHRDRYLPWLGPGKYYSSMITRPDVSPWIDNLKFANTFASLWLDRRAVVVCEPKGSMGILVRRGNPKAHIVHCPRHEAYSMINELTRAVIDLKPQIALLSAGPTATCMAQRLCKAGIQAIDMGSAGGYLQKHLYG